MRQLRIFAAAMFGFFHGHAHGGEMPALATPALYSAGFVVSTIALHVLGVVIGRCTPSSAATLVLDLLR